MERTILQYQRAFKSIVDKMKADEKVLGVMVFGSMMTGDLWEESDIDMFVIVDENISSIQNIYTEEEEVPIHIKLIGKNKFLQIHEENLKGGYIHRIFAASKLVFSKDMEISSRYDSGRFLPDIDRERWNMVYLGRLLKTISESKKYLSKEVIHSSYSIAVKCIRNFAKLYVNYSGYMINRDAITMAMDLNSRFSKCVEDLFISNSNTKEAIETTINYLQKEIDDNIKNLTSILLDYMREKDRFLSSQEIKNDRLFKEFDIYFEDILDKLWEKKIIKKKKRAFNIGDGKPLFEENVYFI